MFSWLEHEILTMPGTDYLVLYGILLAGFLFLLYYSFIAFRRFRFVGGTATSKIRSAAQGHVELKGLGELMQNDTIHSPFSGSRCVWYHCSIDKKTHRGKRTTWTNISDECSSHLFRLVDDTGECIIDPDHAHVIPELDLTWYGHRKDYRSRPPKKNNLISLGLGSYRFRERLIRPATQLYVLGWFHTLYNDPSDDFIASQAEDLVKQWKLQPQRYLQAQDFDHNGRIQKSEWKAVHAAARKQALANINRQNSEHHVISRPADKRQPYILSALGEKQLVARKKLKAYSSVATAFALFGTLLIMFSIRAPLPI